MSTLVKTIRDEVLDAYNMGTTADSSYESGEGDAEAYLTQTFIDRLTYANIRGSETTFNLAIRGANFDFGTGTPRAFQVYHIDGGRRYDYFLSPHFTVEADVDYQLNASRSLEVTSDGNRDSRDTITVSAVPVNFAMLMCDIFRILGNHYSRVIAQSQGSNSVSPATVRAELMKQSSHWGSENFLYG